jgi:SAM-dependent methyltransferase
VNDPEFGGAYARPGVYDILHSPSTAGEVDLMQRCARDAAAPEGPWLEPACGTGRYLRVLAARGVAVTGFDRDQGMIDYARRSIARRGLEGIARVLEADMADFLDTVGMRRYAVAFNPVNSFRHLLRPRDVARHLREVAAALMPGGVYLVGISLSRYGEEEPTEDVWTARRGSCSVRQIVQYLPAEPTTRTESVFSHLQVDRPSGRRYFDASYGLRSYDLEQWKGLIRRSPLRRFRAVDDLGQPVDDHIEANYQIEVLRRN